MRYLKIISVLFICAVFLHVTVTDAALSRVQVMKGVNTGFASSVTTAAATTTSGNMLIVSVEADVVAQNGITVTDNKSNSWTRVTSTAAAATFDHEVWVSCNITGGSGHTITATDNGGGVDSLIIVEEWSGQATTACSDVAKGATNVATTAMDSGTSATTTQANEVVIGAGVASGNVSITVGNGYSNLNTATTTFSTLLFESKIVSAIGTQRATSTSGTAGTFVMHVASFKEATAAATTRRRMATVLMESN